MKKLFVVATLSIAVAAVFKRVTEKNESHSKQISKIFNSEFIKEEHLQTISRLLQQDK